jgi:hypothetical protein
LQNQRETSENHFNERVFLEQAEFHADECCGYRSLFCELAAARESFCDPRQEAFRGGSASLLLSLSRNFYGFLRLPCSKDGVNPNVSYYHEKFLRGQPELMELIPRTRLKRHSMRRPLDPNSQPNFSGMMVLPDAPKEIWAVSAGLKTVGLTGNLYAPSTILASSQEMLNDCNSYGLTRNNPGFTRRGTFDGTSNLGRHGLAAQQLPPSEGSRPFYGPRKLVSNDAPPREISVVVRAQSPFVLERGLRNYASFDDFDDSRR